MTNTPLASAGVDIGAGADAPETPYVAGNCDRRHAVRVRRGAMVGTHPRDDRVGGLVLIFICIGGWCWCALYIGGRKNHELVTTGPYSITRNPLYLFSIVGAVGVGAQFGGISVALLAGLFVTIIHLLVVRQEERLLLALYGEIYRQYVAEVPRFLPDFLRWNDVDMIEVQPRAVVATFLDACLFLASVPIAESSGVRSTARLSSRLSEIAMSAMACAIARVLRARNAELTMSALGPSRPNGPA